MTPKNDKKNTAPVSTDPIKIESLLTRRVVEVVVEESLRKKLASGRQLRIKLGCDPTKPDLLSQILKPLVPAP